MVVCVGGVGGMGGLRHGSYGGHSGDKEDTCVDIGCVSGGDGGVDGGDETLHHMVRPLRTKLGNSNSDSKASC